MTRTPDEPRARRGNDLMALLAAARPASLDPGPQTPGLATQLAATAATAARSGADTGAMSTAAAGAGRAVPAGQPAARRGRGRPGLRVSVAAAGAALAAAVAVIVAISGSVTAPGTAGAGGRDRSTAAPEPSARAILLTAAVNAAKAPSAGRYWRVEMLSAQTSTAGPNAHPYAVLQRWAPSVYWDARSSAQRTWTFPAVGSTSVPASSGARAAWQADGSPALPVTHSAQTAWWQTGGGVGYFGNSSPTAAQFGALPSDPAVLAAAVRRTALAQEQASPVSGDQSGQPTLDQEMFGAYMQLLEWDPITPQVRAAVFRDLAVLPGVRSVGQMTDPLGRPGFGLALTSSTSAQDPTGQEEILVVAPGSGALLADEYVATGSPAAKPSSSGAVPGLAKCPAGATVVKVKMCLIGAHVTYVGGHREIAPPARGAKTRFQLLGPTLALAPGQVVSYDAVVSAGWTSAAPALPPLSRQFSVVADGKG